MALFSLFYLISSLLHVYAVYGELKWPAFSWDTVPLFIHMCNASGPFNDEALNFFTKFPLITIEKGQGMYATEEPYASNYAEDNIVDACQSVKKLKPDITCIFYYNSINDWNMYYLHQIMEQNPSYWLRDDDDTVVLTHGDHNFPQPEQGMYVFDYQQKIVVDLFSSECTNLTLKYPGIIDGCFVDKPGTPTFENYSFTQQELTTYNDGHMATITQTQAYLNRTGNSVLISNDLHMYSGVIATQMKGFQGAEENIENMMKWTRKGVLLEARANGAKDNCTDITDSLAGFLIAAEKYSYYACSTGWFVEDHWLDWHKEYDYPLGEPLAQAVKTNDVWTREFKSGTKVIFNVTSSKGQILWAHQM